MNDFEHAWHQNPKVPERDHSLMYTMELVKKHGRMDWKNKAYVDRLQAEIVYLKDLLATERAAVRDAEAETIRVEADLVTLKRERDEAREALRPFAGIAVAFDYMPAGAIIVVHMDIDHPRAAQRLLSTVSSQTT